MIDWIEEEKPQVPLSEPVVPFTIALLEDDAALVKLISTTFQRAGYRVMAFTTLEEGRRALASNDWDLLLCDRRLPDGDGLSLCLELKSRRSALSRYVIVMTGEGSEQAKLEGFDSGADDYIIKPASLPELLARVKAGLRIVELQKALVESNRRLEQLSLTDSLTGLRNRRSFQAAMVTAFEHASRYERPLSLVMLDIDRFKHINDEHGHQIGDDVLEAVGQIVRDNTRVSDLSSRFGGEEFAIILPETHLMQAYQVAEKIRKALAATVIPTAGAPLYVTASLGVASMPHSRFDDVRAMITAADKAMYRSKNRGRNLVEMERRADPGRTTIAGAGEAARGAAIL